MTETILHDVTGNHLLACLPKEDFSALQPHLTRVELPLRKMLEPRNRRIEHVYFPEQGFVSVVANGSRHGGVEVGIIGREGATGLAVIMGTDRSPHETYVQLAGRGLRMPAQGLRQAMEERPALRRALLHYGHAFIVQTAYTALANGRGKIEERLARWLLMAHDRSEGDDLSLTHEFLALMLGVRRPGVTIALNMLERNGLIRVKRGAISILDRAGLAEAASGTYGAPEMEFKRLFGERV